MACFASFLSSCGMCDERSDTGSPRTIEAPDRDDAEITTLMVAFKRCDPEGTGYIKDHERFAKIAKKISVERGDTEQIWRTLDQDGNGAVSFPEFVEWAERCHVALPLGVGGGEIARSMPSGAGGMTFPPGWRGPKDDPQYAKLIPIKDSELVVELQGLMDATYKKTWTRDRKATGVNKVPDRYELISAEKAENFSDWKRYWLRRHHVVSECQEGYLQRYRPLTGSADSLCNRHLLQSATCNEWLLLHGTSPENARTICNGDFTMHLAGSATGTLYGRGTYFADSITKADEYAREDKDGLCSVLVCRVTGGQVFYNDDVNPDAQRLQDAVLKGRFHSILGDREKCRGTYKEYVVFDADQVYVEYVLYYRRQYDR